MPSHEDYIIREFSACRQYENEIGTGGKAVNTENEVEFHIFSGMQAERGEFPYMVALGYENDDVDEENPDAIRYNCGGTLISSQYVLTAAHCVNNVQEKVPIEVSSDQRVPSSRS